MCKFRRRILFGFLFFIVFSFTLPLYFQPDLAALETTAVKAGDFAPGQLEAHYLKHGYQFGDISQEDYLQDAQALLDAAPGEDVLEKIRPNGDVEHFRVSSGEFAVMTHSGRIRTYFKTDERYWFRSNL